MTTHPDHIPVDELAALLNHDGHKRADFVRDLHMLVAAHATLAVDIATGATAYHPDHGDITIISARPTRTGHVTIAVPHASNDDGVETATVYAHELTPERPPLPAKLTTRQHYRQAPIGTAVTITAGDSGGVIYTKKGPNYWVSGWRGHAERTDSDMTDLLTILHTDQ